MPNKISLWLETLPPRGSYLLAALCGGIAAAILPPFFLWALAPIAFGGLYLLLINARGFKQSFWVGWWFGFAHHVLGLYWIANALLTDPEQFGWMVPFAVSGIPAAMAVYIGMATALHHRLVRGRARRLFGAVLFAALWVFTEFLRAHLFTGFPWNLIGYAFNVSDATLQAGSFLGIYGLSFIVVLGASMPALLFFRPQPAIPAVLTFTLLVPLLLYAYGAHRLAGAQVEHTDINLHIVQADITQQHKWDPEKRLMNVRAHLDLSRGAPRHSLVLWPETATPFFLHDDGELRGEISKALGPDKTLITGALRMRPYGPGPRDFDLWNALEVLRGGEILTFYTKNRLVPFGEYVPLRPLIPFVQKITAGGKDFSRGEGPVTRSASGVPVFLPLICYEVIFPEYSFTKERPEWMVNITNDGWFGISTGPHQHFEMARMRAVEQGVPLARVANTGISGVVNPYGKVESQIALGTRGFIDVKLPKPMIIPPLYARWGDAPAFSLIAALLIFAYGLVRNKKD